MEQPFELGESGNNSYLDQEAPTSISRGSSLVFEIEDCSYQDIV